MSAYQRLDMRQGQSLVMTPQLQQAIKLLQLSNIELAEFVAEEIERNPLLERKDSSASEDFDGDGDDDNRDLDSDNDGIYDVVEAGGTDADNDGRADDDDDNLDNTASTGIQP